MTLCRKAEIFFVSETFGMTVFEKLHFQVHSLKIDTIFIFQAEIMVGSLIKLEGRQQLLVLKKGSCHALSQPVASFS